MLGLQRFIAVQLHRGICVHGAPNRSKNKEFGDRRSSFFRHYAVGALPAASQISISNPSWGQQQWQAMESGFLIAIALKHSSTITSWGFQERFETELQLSYLFVKGVKS